MRSFVGLLVCLVALSCGVLRAQDVTWVGGTLSFENDFHTAANWMPAIVPGVGQRALITGAGFQPTISSDVNIGEVVINAGASNPGVLTISAGADVTVGMITINSGASVQVSRVDLFGNSTLSVDTLNINPNGGGHADVNIGLGSTVTVNSACNVSGAVAHSGRIQGAGAFLIGATGTMNCGTTAGQPVILSVAVTQVSGDLIAAQSEINIGGGSAVLLVVTGAGSSLSASGSGVKVQDGSTLRTLAGGQLSSSGSNNFDFEDACVLDIDGTQTGSFRISTFGSSGAPALLQGSANPICSSSSNIVIESSNGAGGFLRVNESGLVVAGSILLDSINSNNNISLEIPNSTNFQIDGVLELNGDTSDQSNVIGAGALIVNTAGTLNFSGNGSVSSILTCDGGIYVQSGQPTITQAPLIVGGDLSVEIAGSLTLGGGLTIDGGSMNVLGTVTATTVLIDNGILEGFGSVIGDVTNAGVFRPGGSESTGALVIDGTYVQTSQGRVEIEIAGILDYDQLITNGSTTVFNTIAFEFLNGYVPANDTVFTAVVNTQSNPLNGTFTNVEQDIALPTVTLTPEYSAGNMNLRATVVAAPPGTPNVTSVVASRTLAPVGAEITFTATATEPGGLNLTYSWDFKDGTNGAGTPITHAFTQGGTFVVQVTVSNGTNSAQGTVSVEILAPNSGGSGETNVGQGKPAVENPLNGIALAISSSNGGVVELAVDVDALNRDVFDLTTTFDGFVGRQSTRFGPRPTDKFTTPTITVATTTATDEGTTTERGKARRHVAVSSREVGQPVPFTAAPVDRSVKLDSIKGKFLFSDTKADQFTFTGRIELPEGLDLSQARSLELAIGNLIDRVELDAKGKTKAKGSQNRIIKAQVKYPKLAKGSTLTRAGQEARISLTMRGVNFSEQGFDTEGIAPTLRADEAGAKAVSRSIQASILFGGATWEAPIPVQFKLTKTGDSGSLVGRGVK